MKRINIFVLMLILVASSPCFALNYTITFTGSGASTTIDNVIVQNLTKGTTVTVPTGNVLNLLDVATTVEQLSATDETIQVYPNSIVGKFTVSFFAKKAGVTQINIFSIDGKKITGINTHLEAGSNAFELSLPKGIFAIHVTGNEYKYTTKVINKTSAQSKPGITYNSTEKPASSSPQKSKSSALGVTAMMYATGDKLLYKATSGTCKTIVTDVPTDSKTTNFNFVVCTDADSNNYTTVAIGTQTWMVENLKTTRYNDGSAIPNVTDITAWTNSSTPAYCWYNNDATTYKNTYGALYNWYAVNTTKLAPIGWHVSTDAEWITLLTYLGGQPEAGGKLKESGMLNWKSPNTGATNETGFFALPGGSRHCGNGTFNYLGSFGTWWNATEFSACCGWIRYLDYNSGFVDQGGSFKAYGFSVRCVMDSP